MRIDPKYFNLFIGICAVLTILIIFYSTVRYSNKQVRDFEHTIIQYNFNEVDFRSYTSSDSLRFEQLFFDNRPVIIHFWSTWSGRSLDVNHFLDEYRSQYPKLLIVAASVRDSDEHIQTYIEKTDFEMTFIEGTELYQALKAPGMPTQLLFLPDGSLHSSHVGSHQQSLKNELDNLMGYAQ